MAKSKLSTGDYVFLAFLRMGPRSAYDVKKEMAASINFFWSAQHSQVYQQATRLRRDGYIETRGDTTGRNRQLLALTATGREALEQWLGEPAAPYRIYDESLAKVYFSNLADPIAVEKLLVDVEAHHRELLREFEDIKRVLDDVDFGDVIPGQLYALRLGIAVERAYITWSRQTRDDLKAQTTPKGKTKTSRRAQNAPSRSQLKGACPPAKEG
jgi:DNA-binding PadR family transcriptional regulator